MISTTLYLLYNVLRIAMARAKMQLLIISHYIFHSVDYEVKGNVFYSIIIVLLYENVNSHCPDHMMG